MPERELLQRLAAEIPDTEVNTASLFLQYLKKGDRASAATLLRIVLPSLNPYSDEDRRSVQLAVAEALSKSENAEEALSEILRRVAETMGCPRPAPPSAQLATVGRPGTVPVARGPGTSARTTQRPAGHLADAWQRPGPGA